MGDDTTEQLDELAAKSGARNNSADRGHVREIRKLAGQIHEHTVAMEPNDEDKPPETHMGGQPMKNAIKAVSKTDDELRVGNYIILFGNPEQRDLEGLGSRRKNKDGSKGEYFSPTVDVDSQYTKAGSLDVDWEHGADPDNIGNSPENVLGRVDWKTAVRDKVGIYVERILNRRNKYMKWLEQLIEAGLVGNSSQAISNSGVVKSTSGEIQKWPLFRDSLTVTPMEPRMMTANQLQAVKALGIKIEQPIAADTNPQKSVKGEIEMDEDKVQELVAAAIKADREAEAARVKAAKEEQDRIDAAVKAAREDEQAKAAKSRRLPFSDAPYVTQFSETDKYDNLSPEDHSLMIEILRSNHQSPPAASIKALALKLKDTKVGYIKSAMIRAGLGDEAAIKAHDPMVAGTDAVGADWVGTAYSNQMWEVIRASGRVVSKFPSEVIPDGYSNKYWPVEGADPTWYKIAETTAVNDTTLIPNASVLASQVATDQKQITVAKMGARVLYTGELVEDSLIAVAPQLRAQLEKSGTEMMEYVSIDGDTTATTQTNINDIGGSTYSGAATSLFLLTDGIRHVALATATQYRSAAGSFVAEDFLDTVRMLGTNGVGYSDPTKCSFIVDPNTHFAAAKLPEAKDANQTIFSVDGGLVTRAYLVDVIPSWFMHYMSSTRKANTAGKVDNDTAANNAYGAILAIRWDQWKLAYKHRMNLETTRIANADTWEITAMARWGLGARDTLAAAITYYVGV